MHFLVKFQIAETIHNDDLIKFDFVTCALASKKHPQNTPWMLGALLMPPHLSAMSQN